MPIVTNYTAVHFQVLKSDTNFWCKLRKILQLSHFCGNKLFLGTTTFALIVQYPFLFSMPHLNVQPEKMLLSRGKSLRARLRKPFIRIEFHDIWICAVLKDESIFISDEIIIR